VLDRLSFPVLRPPKLAEVELRRRRFGSLFQIMRDDLHGNAKLSIKKARPDDRPGF
jgi:hypothetical protein